MPEPKMSDAATSADVEHGARPGAMHPNQERLESGEKVFVITFLFAFVVEVILAIAAVLSFVWIGALFGAFCAGFVLYLANRLYGGDPKARQLAYGWIGFSLLIAAIGLALAIPGRGTPHLGRYLAIVAPWAGGFKLIAYLTLGSALLLTRSSRYFVTVRTGGTVPVEDEAPDTGLPTGVVLKLTAQQAAPVADAARNLNCASVTLFVLGGLLLLNAAKEAVLQQPTALTTLAHGVLALLLGGFLVGPRRVVREVQEQPDTGYVVNALNRLRGLFFYHAVITLGMVALIGIQFARWLTSGE